MNGEKQSCGPPKASHHPHFFKDQTQSIKDETPEGIFPLRKKPGSLSGEVHFKSASSTTGGTTDVAGPEVVSVTTVRGRRRPSRE